MVGIINEFWKFTGRTQLEILQYSLFCVPSSILARFSLANAIHLAKSIKQYRTGKLKSYEIVDE